MVDILNGWGGWILKAGIALVVGAAILVFVDCLKELPATLLLRGMECRAMVLHARLAALPSMTHESRYSVEYQVMGLQGVDPCIA